MVMIAFWIYACASALILLFGVPSEAFSPPHNIGGTAVSNSKTTHRVLLYGSSGDGEDGGTGWIKKAMDSGDGEGNKDGTPPPPSPSPPNFTQDEINIMEGLILDLSKISDDDKRREALAGILDKELAAASNIASLDPEVKEDDSVLDVEVPRFAKLFQLSLDNVGERVQNAAREKALELQQQQIQQQQTSEDANTGSSEEGEMIKRVKSDEELQLWALIDIMVQSKTRVKLYMGSLGSKGEFR